MAGSYSDSDYSNKLAAEGRKWDEHLKVEASGDWNAWLDHPLIAQHYRERTSLKAILGAMGDQIPYWAGRKESSRLLKNAS